MASVVSGSRAKIPRGRYPTAGIIAAGFFTLHRFCRFPRQLKAPHVIATKRRRSANPPLTNLVARGKIAAYTFGSVFGFKGAGL
jgi:hypothetical protein